LRRGLVQGPLAVLTESNVQAYLVGSREAQMKTASASLFAAAVIGLLLFTSQSRTEAASKTNHAENEKQRTACCAEIGGTYTLPVTADFRGYCQWKKKTTPCKLNDSILA